MASLAWAPAQAADWSGFYVGGHAGYAWGEVNKSMTPDAAYPAAPAFLSAMQADFSSPFRAGNAIGGGQIGFNWQRDRYVLGFEVDATWLGLRAHRQFSYPASFPLPPNTVDQDVKVSWMTTVRPRIGITFDRTLVYVTGGLAIAEVQAADSVFHPGSGSVTVAGTVSQTKVGAAVGAGFEYMLAANWSLRGEYLYADLGRVTASAPSSKPIAFPTANASFETHVTASLARLGLNYRF